MATIKNITARQILDSRGRPTLTVKVETENNFGEFSVPSGASTGSHEAHELRDGGGEWGGAGVNQAIQNVETIIAPALAGLAVQDQAKLDQVMLELDGTANRNQLGGNAIIGVSVACAVAAARAEEIQPFEYLRRLAGQSKPLSETPLLFMNLINGGKHSSSKLDWQEYHLIPQTDNPTEALAIGTAVMQALAPILREQYGDLSANQGDEGGFVPAISDPEAPLAAIWQAVRKTGVEDRVKLGLDVAASSFYEAGKYKINGQDYSAQQLLELYQKICRGYPMLSIEDPFAEEDFADFAKLQAEQSELLVIGDDLTVTNSERLKQAIELKSISGVIIKPNQVGSLTETLQTIKLAQDNNIKCIASHRSGETNDSFIADLAVGLGCYGLKAGAPASGERVAKYNRLVEISTLIKQK